jgi:pilus assembly protein CpaF
VLGEVRGGEAFDLLQALNTGHAGTLSTIHANSAEQALARLASCVVQSGVDIPYQAVRQQIGDAIQFVLHLQRVKGSRVVTELLRVRRYDLSHDRYETDALYGDLTSTGAVDQEPVRESVGGPGTDAVIR